MTTDRIVLYGDFNCPWSYLASARAARLAATGQEVEWRAVEHDPWRPRRFMDSSSRFQELRGEMGRVTRLLLPDEELPFALAGFLPRTRAAVTGYAEAFGAGVAERARRLLFDAFWLHGVDIGDPRLVRTMLVDTIRSGSPESEPLSDWGYGVDVTGGPITTGAWRLIGQWHEGWLSTGKQVVPTLVVGGHAPLHGVEAVEWLGTELAGRGVDPAAREPAPAPSRRVDAPDHSWVTQHGNRWLREFQSLQDHPLFPRAG